MFVMLSAPAGRMTCLLLSNHLQITCFRSAASSKDSLNLGVPLLAWFAQFMDTEMWGVLLQFIEHPSWYHAGCITKDEAHAEHRPLQDQTLLDGESGNTVFCPVWTKAGAGLSHAAVAELVLGILVCTFSKVHVTTWLLVLSWILSG